MNFSAPSLPRPSLNIIHAVKANTGKTSAPKLTGIHIHPVSNGVKVAHLYSGAPSKQFVFTDPRKMASHLKRTLHNEWLSPVGSAEHVAGKIEHDTNL